ncbi:acyltransferase family protein [Prevotella falsenii]
MKEIPIKKRESNFELLRIIAMLLVMITHATFLSLGIPTHEDSISTPYNSFGIFLSQSFSTVCVNIFILLSGWFGIKANLKRFSEFIFQLFFFTSIIFIGFYIFSPNVIANTDALLTFFMFHSSDYWFVKAYIGLYLFSPILNTFAERASQKQLGYFLISFFIFQTIYGWLSIDGVQWIGGGYSAVSFFFLYLAARYTRQYLLPDINKISQSIYISSYISIVLFIAILAFIVTRFGLPIAGRLFTYTNPLVLLESLLLLIIFSRISIKSKIINWVGISCFSVYLLHANELLLRPYYGKIINNLSVTESTEWFLVFTMLFILSIFLISILLDKVRIAIWNILIYNSFKQQQ